MRNEMQEKTVSSSAAVSRSDRWIGIPALAICLLLAEAIVATVASICTSCIMLWCRYLDQPKLGYQMGLGVGAFLILVDAIVVARFLLQRPAKPGFPVFPALIPNRTASPVASQLRPAA